METQVTTTELAPLEKHTAKEEFDALHDRMAASGTSPSREDVTAMRQLMVTNPEILPAGWTLHETLRDNMIREVTNEGSSRAAMLAEVDRWLIELGYATAPALERVLFDSIVTCRLRLLLIEFRQNAALGGGKIPVIEHTDKLLSSAHNRLTRAVESLARVRLLATRGPVFQVNVAMNGGQQVNTA